MNSSHFNSEHVAVTNSSVTSQRVYEASSDMDNDSLPFETSKVESLNMALLEMAAITCESGAMRSADSEIRQHMCSMLTELRSNARILVHLMRQHDFVSMLSEQQFVSYQQAIERLGITSMQMDEVIEASNYLDRLHSE